VSQRAEEIKAGVMVLVGAVLFIAALVAILGLNVQLDLDRYSTLFKYSAGVEPGTVVRFGGLKVGKVTTVELSREHPTMVELRLAVNPGTPIRQDSQVKITTLSALGDNYIEITTGSPESPLVSPGSLLESVPTTNMGDVFAKVEGVVGQVDTMFAIVNQQILTQDMQAFRERIRTISEQASTLLTDVDDVFNTENRQAITQTLETIRDTLQENRSDVRTVVTNMRGTSERMQKLAELLETVVSDAQPDVQIMLRELRDTATQANTLAGRLDALVAENRPDINLMVDNLTATSANARDLTETLAEQPWRLIWRTTRPEKISLADEQ